MMYNNALDDFQLKLTDSLHKQNLIAEENNSLKLTIDRLGSVPPHNIKASQTFV